MEIDVETHSQTLCRAQGIIQKRKKDCRSQRNQVQHHKNPQNQLTTAHRGSQRMNQQLRTVHGTDLSLLHICQSYATLSFCATPKWEQGLSFFVPCARFWDPFSHTGLPCSTLMWREVPSLTSTWYARFGCYPWEACPFLNRRGKGEGVGGE